ncbi:MAG: hypothetical protein NTV57_18945 [Cyanobacteria bacterium]|nr:hypothetical protein [Cyanobacteriota bacterium]
MSALQLLLVLDPAEPAHQTFAGRLKSLLVPGEHLRCEAWSTWSPGPCRAPGSPGDQEIVLLLAPARWLRHQPTAALPPDVLQHVLVVAELCGRAARELGPGGCRPGRSRLPLRCVPLRPERRLAADLSRAASPAEPGAMASAPAALPARPGGCAAVVAAPLRRAPTPVADAPLAELLGLLPARAPALRARLSSRRRWLQGSLRQRWSNWRQPGPADWQIAIGRLAAGSDRVRIVHRLLPQGGDWFADPFLLAEGPNLWLFCERWQAASRKGVIDLFAVRPQGLLPMGTVIEEPFHLSFPRVFRHAGSWWASVESAAAGEVRLYRAESFPTGWRLERVLLSGQAWIDPILLPAETGGSSAGGWWLLVNSHPLPALPGETASALQLFHSPDLLHGPFEPHHASPLLLDSSCGRNGGLLQLDYGLIRVGQCTGLNNAYGESVQLRRIEVLDGQCYREAPLLPAWLEELRRQLHASHLHTVNNQGEWLALDWRPRAGAELNGTYRASK